MKAKRAPQVDEREKQARWGKDGQSSWSATSGGADRDRQRFDLSRRLRKNRRRKLNFLSTKAHLEWDGVLINSSQQGNRDKNTVETTQFSENLEAVEGTFKSLGEA